MSTSSTPPSTTVEPVTTDSKSDTKTNSPPTPSPKDGAKKKVVPVGSFLNIAIYFGTFFLFIFFLIMFIKVLGGGKSSS